MRTLRVQLTDECNLHCVYCCHEGTKNDYSIIKNKNLITFIRSCHDVLGIKRVKFTGGEPLEYDQNIADIISNIQLNDISFSIVTNATNFAKFSALVDAAPNLEVTISLPVPKRLDYVDVYQQLTGAHDKFTIFNNVINCIDYMIDRHRLFKINYVLCRGINTDDKYIQEMLQFAAEHPNLQLRFLETAVNATNNDRHQMDRLVFSAKNFEETLDRLGVNNKINDTRSFSEYNINNTTIKLIKFFCSNSCTECPKDKTSLWLTSTGTMKMCSFLPSSTTIKNWQYSKLTEQLEVDIASRINN